MSPSDQLGDRLVARRAETDPDYLDAVAAAARHLDRAGMPGRRVMPGDRAPDFALRTAEGRAVSLSGRLSDGPVAISFFRGEWCPFCRAEIDALLAAAPALARRGASLLLVSPEAPSRGLAAAVAALGDRAALLRDPALGVALLYGLTYAVPDPLRLFYLGRNAALARDLAEGGWMLALPADYVVGRDGRVRLSWADPDFTRRLEPALLLGAIGNFAGRADGAG